MRFRDGVLHVGEPAVPELASRFGTPLYIYDAAVIRRQIGRVRDAFAAMPFQPFYAMKANGNLAILRMIASAGFGCDCVSPGEIFVARHAGFLPDRIWFTCSNVSDDDLLAVGDPAIVVNVNSISELQRCVRLRLPNPIALRVNPDVGAGHHRDVVTGGFGVKFGLEVHEIESARDLAERAGVEIAGLHAHIGSGIDTIDPLIESAKRLLLLSEHLPHLRWINFGGGISVPYEPGEKEFPIAQYGAALGDLAGPVLSRRGITAILEPGRYLVAESGILVARVTAIRSSSGFDWVGCDTGFNHLTRPSKYGSYHHIVNASRGSQSDLRNSESDEPSDGSTVVTGNICESGDVFTRDSEGVRPRRLGVIAVDDLIAFCDAGAYGFSMASSYNARPLPAEVMVDGDTVVLVRERQHPADFLRGQPE